jgi:hypothetical protein
LDFEKGAQETAMVSRTIFQQVILPNLVNFVAKDTGMAAEALNCRT